MFDEYSLESLEQQVEQLRQKPNRAAVAVMPKKVYDDMSVEEYTEIVRKYGDNVQAIKKAEGSLHQQRNFVQNTLKVLCRTDPVVLKAKCEELSKQYEIFRTAIYTTSQKHSYMVLLKKRMPNIRFFDFTQEEKAADMIRDYITADRKNGFRIDREPLIRINIFQVETELSFVVVTQITSDDGMENTKQILNSLFGKAILYRSNQTTLSVPQGNDPEGNERFWLKYLYGIKNQTLVPGFQKNDSLFERKCTHLVSDSSLVEGMEQMAKRCGTGVNDVMEAVWAVLIYQCQKNPDVLYGIADGEVSLDAWPLRVSIIESDYIELLVRSIHRLKKEMREHSGVSVSKIESKLGIESAVMNHVLSFHNMTRVADNPEKSEKAVMLGMVSYKEEQWDFCLHIRFLDNRLALNCIYNACCISVESVESLLNIYLKMLQKAVEEDKVKIRDLALPDYGQIFEYEKQKKRKLLQMVLFLSDIPMFEKVPIDEIEEIAAVSHVEQLVSEEMAFHAGDGIDYMDVIIQGHVQLLTSDRCGFEKPVLLLKTGEIISNEWMLEKPDYALGAKAVENDTRLLRIPVGRMEQLEKKYSGVRRQIFRVEHERGLKMASLWIND